MNSSTTAASKIVSSNSKKLDRSDFLVNTGEILIRSGMVLVIGWIGAMKFTAYEAQGISGFVQSSPLLSWTYSFLSLQAFSNGLGIVELAIASGLLLGAINPRIGIGAATAAIGMFATTLSFMLTTPGTFEASLGFPALSVVPGQFLIKDVVSLGAAVWLLGKSLKQLNTKH